MGACGCGQTRGPEEQGFARGSSPAAGAWPARDSSPRAAPAQRGPGARSPGAAVLLRAEKQERGQQPGQRVHGLGRLGAGPAAAPGSGRSRELEKLLSRRPRRRRHKRAGAGGRAARARGRTERGARSRPAPRRAARPPPARPPSSSGRPACSSPPASARPPRPRPGVRHSPSQRRCPCRPERVPPRVYPGGDSGARPAWTRPLAAGQAPADRRARQNLVPPWGGVCHGPFVGVTGPRELVRGEEGASAPEAFTFYRARRARSTGSSFQNPGACASPTLRWVRGERGRGGRSRSAAARRSVVGTPLWSRDAVTSLPGGSGSITPAHRPSAGL